MGERTYRSDGQITGSMCIRRAGIKLCLTACRGIKQRDNHFQLYYVIITLCQYFETGPKQNKCSRLSMPSCRYYNEINSILGFER